MTDESAAVARLRSLEAPRGRDLDAVVAAVRRGDDVPDRDFDDVYPPRVRALSAQHWTPVAVARRAAAWLAAAPGARVLDVGAGAGKFCLVGALATPGAFTGVERRGALVAVARAVAAAHGVEAARYVHGDIRDVDWAAFEGFYLFNPFAEHYLPEDERIDADGEFSLAGLTREVAWVEAQLARARLGTRVATFHGFGGYLSGYDRVSVEPLGTSILECWEKVRDEDHPAARWSDPG